MISKNKVKNYASLKQKKYRKSEGKFLIEGFHLIEECLDSSYFLECIIVSENAEIEKFPQLFGKIDRKRIPVHILKDNQFNKISDTENSQGIAGVVHKKNQGKTETLFKSNLIIALDRINDPGNLGTIIRTAYWFGADTVITGDNSVDVYNSKVLRSTQGGIFHINVIENLPLEITLDKLNKSGFNIYLLDINAEKSLSVVKHKVKTVFVFGNEAEGISDSVINSGYKRVKISGYTGCESLNVAVSCGIVLYEYCKK